MTLRGYFELIELSVRGISYSDVKKRIDAETLLAIEKEGLLRNQRRCTSWECDKARGGGGGCEREVFASSEGVAAPWTAVCEGSLDDGSPCVPLFLSEEDVTLVALGYVELGRAVHRLYGLEGAPAVFADDAFEAPVLLGTTKTKAGVRDVFLALAPRDSAFGPFLQLREKGQRASLVLVPTGLRLGADVGVRYGRGALVEVQPLDEELAVRDGKLVRASKPKLVRTLHESRGEEDHRATTPPASAKGLAEELGVTKWEDIRITVIDGHTVRIQHQAVSFRRTYLELGFAGRKREPTMRWRLLLAACAGHGAFRWKDFGSYRTVKNIVSMARNQLRDAFGLSDDPFHTYSSKDGWRVKFFASSEIAEDD